MNTSGLTGAERQALVLAGQLFDALAALPPEHVADLGEHVRDIHCIQNRILARPTLRAMRREEGHAAT